MIDAKMIPAEVVEAAARARWGCAKPTEWEKETCRLIIAAALAAWPGVYKMKNERDGGMSIDYWLKLPLPQEPGNE